MTGILSGGDVSFVCRVCLLDWTQTLQRHIETETGLR